jgi:hypothetical protein
MGDYGGGCWKGVGCLRVDDGYAGEDDEKLHGCNDLWLVDL